MCCAFTVHLSAQVSFSVYTAHKQQVIEGMGTAIYPIRTGPDNLPDLYAREDFQDLYIDDMGMSMCRIQIEADQIFPSLEVGQPAFSYDEISYTHPNWDMERGNVRYQWERAYIIDENGDTTGHYGTFDWPHVIDFSSAKVVHDWASTIEAKKPDMKFIASCWSPPAWMKEKNKQTPEGDPIAINSGGGRLLPEYYPHYGKFLIAWVKAMKNIYGVDIYALSFQNEPLFSQSFSSCVYTYEEYTAAFKAIIDEFVNADMGDMKFFGAEDMTHFPARTEGYLSGIIDDPYYSQFLYSVATHGYTDGVESKTDPSTDSAIFAFADEYDKQYWMTESGSGEMTWEDTDGGKGALNQCVAGIHNILVKGNGSAITFWQIASGDKDHATGHELMAYDNHTKSSHAYRHYAKNIRPGAFRVHASPDQQDDVHLSAFYDDTTNKLVINLFNLEYTDKEVHIDLKNFGGTDFEVIRTSATEDYATLPNMTASDNALSFTLSQRALVTLISYGPLAGDIEPPSAPANLVASNITKTSCDLSWDASSDNVGVSGYTIYINGSREKTVTRTSARIAGLSCGSATPYEFTVKAKDAAENTSDESNTERVNTASCEGSGAFIMDNTNAAVSFSANYWTSTSGSGYYGDNFHTTGNSAGAYARYTPSFAGREGEYEIFVRYTDTWSKSGTDCPYVVNHQNGQDEILVDQTVNGGQWVSIGTYNMAAGDYVDIGAWLSDNKRPCADAIKFSPASATDGLITCQKRDGISGTAVISGNNLILDNLRGTEPATLRIVDCRGRTVLHSLIRSASRVQVPLRAFPLGMYVVNVRSDTETLVRRCIVR